MMQPPGGTSNIFSGIHYIFIKWRAQGFISGGEKLQDEKERRAGVSYFDIKVGVDSLSR